VPTFLLFKYCWKRWEAEGEAEGERGEGEGRAKSVAIELQKKKWANSIAQSCSNLNSTVDWKRDGFWKVFFLERLSSYVFLKLSFSESFSLLFRLLVSRPAPPHTFGSSSPLPGPSP
jgi:hypothetical protein